MLLFKIVGILVLIFACSLLGIYKANALKKRVYKLSSICVSLSKLAQLIHNGAGELTKLLPLSFEEDVLCVTDNFPILDMTFLEKTDIELFEGFLKEIGLSDSETEYGRVLTYKSLFENQTEQAKKKSDELSKLYSSLGFLTGVAISIFLI